MRAPQRRRPEALMLPPDDRRLEDIIGSLQSEMGVPQSPQEYRLMVKVASERDTSGRSHRPSDSADNNGAGDANGKPKREKAPAPPRVGEGDAATAQREKAPSRKRRSRRRRRGGRRRESGGNPPPS
ncbi:MAG: hypothetical protein ACRDJL_01090 [Actinomycetota bacterium]